MKTKIKAEELSTNMCKKMAKSGHICTRKKGHKGLHIAHIDEYEASNYTNEKGWLR